MLKNISELIRLNIGILSIFSLIASLLILEIPYFLWLFPIISVFLITVSGNVINDYFDFEIDKINKPKRPIPSGKISKKTAFYIYLSLLILGLIFSSLISVNFFILAIFNSLIIFLYSYKFKKTLIGNFADSWLAVSVFLSPVLIFGTFQDLIYSKIIILALIAFFGNYGREILKDVEDVKGDKKQKAKTIPIVFGKNTAICLGKMLILIGGLLLFVPYFIKIFSELYFFLSLICFGVCIYILTLKKVSSVQKMTKFLMFIIVLVFVVSFLI